MFVKGTTTQLDEHSDGTPYVQIWFRGFGKVLGDPTEFFYWIKLFGTMDVVGSWPPEGASDSTVMTLTSWEMGIEKKKHKGIACTGTGVFDEPEAEPPPSVKIGIIEHIDGP